MQCKRCDSDKCERVEMHDSGKKVNNQRIMGVLIKHVKPRFDGEPYEEFQRYVHCEKHGKKCCTTKNVIGKKDRKVYNYIIHKDGTKDCFRIPFAEDGYSRNAKIED